MKKHYICTLIALLSLMVLMHLSSALIIRSIDSEKLYPGTTGIVRVSVDNDLNEDIEDVTFSMDLTGLPISSVGSSEDSIDSINSDDIDKFVFTLRASNDAKPGDYKIPYVLAYLDNPSPKKGTFAVSVGGNTEIEYSTSLENPVIGKKGKINLKIINKGEGEARFMSVNILPDGYTLLSESKTYVGTVNADDFESASFDVLFNSEKANLLAIVEYKDLDNKQIITNINIPLVVYTQQEASTLGIIPKNNTVLYISIVIILLAIWLIWRAVKKRIRRKKSIQQK